MNRWHSTALRELPLPSGRHIRGLIHSFSPAERLLFVVLLAAFCISAITLLYQTSAALMVEVPSVGGELTEGVIGTPRFINPLLAVSSADRDLSALIYAGLMKPTPEGTLEAELAESFSISENGRTYDFVLRQDATFHDGEPVTADDVIFTIKLVQDPALKSSLFANWEGVAVEKINEHAVRFVLEEPYAPFLENTTIGILPEHLWKHASIDEIAFSNYNVEPVGAGPYQMDSITRNDAGIPEQYALNRFSDYVLGAPNLSRIKLRFYRNEQELVEAMQNGIINAIAGLTPSRLAQLTRDSEHRILTAPLPRIFGVFFNKNRNEVFARKEVREALNLALGKQRIVNEVLGGYGSVIDSPLPLGVLPEEASEIKSADDAATSTPVVAHFEEAESLLRRNGWERNEHGIWERETEDSYHRLSFTLSTANTSDLHRAAQIVAEEWERFGAEVDLTVYEPSDLTNNIIRPRRFDALFFGEIVGRELDLFAFWHSSQRNDPGLNIAGYTNIAADALLTQGRVESDREKRLAAYAQFEEEIRNDQPAVFTHSPDFIYVVPGGLSGIDISSVTVPSERFINVHEWFMETNRVWNFLN